MKNIIKKTIVTVLFASFASCGSTHAVVLRNARVNAETVIRIAAYAYASAALVYNKDPRVLNIIPFLEGNLIALEAVFTKRLPFLAQSLGSTVLTAPLIMITVIEREFGILSESFRTFMSACKYPTYKGVFTQPVSAQDVCAVCHDTLLNPSEQHKPAQELATCSHVFHADCIHNWTMRNAICPLCRAPVKQTRFSLPVFLELLKSTPARQHACAAALTGALLYIYYKFVHA